MAEPFTIALILGAALLGPRLLRGGGRGRGRRSTEPLVPRKQRREARTSSASAKREEDAASFRTRAARGQYTPEEIDDLFAGRLKLRNPMAMAAATMLHAHRNPSCPGGAAAEQSAEFHGTGGIRPLCFHGKGHVVLGELEAIEYRAPRGSQRAGAIWRHEAGDQGDGKPRLRRHAMVVAESDTGRVEVLGGPQRFAPNRGIVG